MKHDPDDTPPSTIRDPEKFMESLPAGWDGWTHWEWIKGCWPNANDTPQDMDMWKERRGQFLVVETKRVGARIPQGQLRGLFELHALGCFTIMLVWGKRVPEHGEVWYPHQRTRRKFTGVAAARRIARGWYQWADGPGARTPWRSDDELAWVRDP